MTPSTSTKPRVHAQDKIPKAVLIVEDHQDVRTTLAWLLRMERFRVGTAADGREALDVLREGPLPDLIVLDLRMPVMDGWEFLACKRRDPRQAGIPVVVCSGSSERLDRSSFPEVIGYKDKPAHPAELVSLLRSVLDETAAKTA